MMNKNKFDKLIRDNINEKDSFGYKMSTKERPYYNYYSNEKFNEFIEGMKKDYSWIYDAYYHGAGCELVEGNLPPKMASVASSSRFCYLSLRNATITDFGNDNDGSDRYSFEKDLPVNGVIGKHPQMDAFYEGERKNYYFEFKCHEIFDRHSSVVSRQYDRFLEEMEIVRNSTEIPVNEFGLEQIGLFDIKQFITHLAGITSHNKGKETVFTYVYFKPSNYTEDKFEMLKSEVEKVFDSEKVKLICQKYNIELRLYFYDNVVMDGFEGLIKPTRVI